MALIAIALLNCAHQMRPFDAALVNARADAKKPAAEKWEMDTAAEMVPKLTATMNACEAGLPPADETFTVVVRLEDEGRVAESVVSPSTKLSQCFRDAISETAFPNPPWDGYWLELQMHR